MQQTMCRQQYWPKRALRVIAHTEARRLFQMCNLSCFYIINMPGLAERLIILMK